MSDGASLSCYNAQDMVISSEERLRINSLLVLSTVFDEVRHTCHRNMHNEDRMVTEFIYSIPEVACALRDAEIKEKLSKSIVALSILDRQQYPQHRESFAEFMAEVVTYGFLNVPDKALAIFQAQSCALVSFLSPYLLNCKVYSAIEEIIMTPKSPSMCVVLAQRLIQDFKNQVFDCSVEWNQTTADTAQLWCGLLKTLVKYVPMENSIEVLENFARCMDTVVPFVIHASVFEARSYVFLPLIIDIINVFGVKSTHPAMYDKMPTLFPSLCRVTQQYIKILQDIRHRTKPNMISPLPLPFSPIKIHNTSPSDHQPQLPHDNITTLLIIQMFYLCVKNYHPMATNLCCNQFLSEAIECIRAKPNNSVLHGEVVHLVAAIVECKLEIYSEMIVECQIARMITLLISEWDKDGIRHRTLHLSEIARILHAAYPSLEILEEEHKWMLSPSLSTSTNPRLNDSGENHHPIKCSPPLRRNFADPCPHNKFCEVQFSKSHLSFQKPGCLVQDIKPNPLRRMASRTKRLLHREDKKDSRALICNQ